MEENIIKIIKRFPGVGIRQAERILYHLRSMDKTDFYEFLKTLEEAVKSSSPCEVCGEMLFGATLCKECKNVEDTSTLLIVEKDTDKHIIVKTKSFHGQYLVLGGLLSILKSSTPRKDTKLERLRTIIKKNNFKEIICAMSDTKESEHTIETLVSFLRNEIGFEGTITTLGRGISTGAEIEYLDPRTLDAALKNRSSM